MGGVKFDQPLNVIVVDVVCSHAVNSKYGMGKVDDV